MIVVSVAVWVGMEVVGVVVALEVVVGVVVLGGVVVGVSVG